MILQAGVSQLQPPVGSSVRYKRLITTECRSGVSTSLQGVRVLYTIAPQDFGLATHVAWNLICDNGE